MLTAIAVDDEPRALEIISLHAEKISFLDLQHTFRDAVDAIAWLQNNPIDLIFLDINMPNLSGLKFRQLIGEKAMIIFTTAYSEYAVESYEQNAVDYLVKPIVFERFLKGVLKAKNQSGIQAISSDTPLTPSSDLTVSSIFIKSGTKHFQLNTDDILFLEKDGNYVFFHTNDRKVISRLNMTQVLDMLPEEKFLRIHKSYIVALQHIDIVENHQVTIKHNKIPIAKVYRKTLLERLNRKK